MGVPYIGNRKYNTGTMNMVVFWVQTQMKQTGRYYQGNNYDVTGNLGSQTKKEIARFMRDRGYSAHTGAIDQAVIDELSSYLGSRVAAVYVGGYYQYMQTIMVGGSEGSMERINSNLIDNVARVTTGARWVQICLKKLGYYTSSIDGKYGEGTENAVKRFQRDYGFQQTNYVTLGVARAMLEACYNRGYSLDDLEWD